MQTSSCIFCRIVEKKSPARIVYEDTEFIAFEDINPQAPVHVLLVPRRHVSSVLELSERDINAVGNMYLAAAKIARQKNIENGFRMVVNSGVGGGQTVWHLHFHLMGGRRFTWPPG